MSMKNSYFKILQQQNLFSYNILILFYDKDGDADIPEDEDTMLRENALKLTRQKAIDQCKKNDYQ